MAPFLCVILTQRRISVAEERFSASYQFSLKSFQFGLLDSISASFFDCSQPLSRFSPSMACSMAGNVSYQTNFVMLYLLVKPLMSLCLCS